MPANHPSPITYEYRRHDVSTARPRNGQELQTSATLLLQIRPESPVRELAWEEFHRRYAPIIAGFARKMGGKPQDREDIVQDVMAGFFAASPQFKYDPTKGRFRGFLKVCTFRAMRRRLGQNARFSGVPLEKIDPEALEVEAAWNDVWEHEHLRRAMRALREEYESTPQRLRTFRAFELFGLLEQPAPDVAKKLDMSVDSVHQAKHRITEALRAKLKTLEETEG
jgi:RNA polymerase sigma-70 factor (ECF subfamily)